MTRYKYKKIFHYKLKLGLDNMEVLCYNVYKNKQKLIPDMSYKRKVLL